jgi:hypothetical protein
MVVVAVVINMFDTHFSVSDNGVIPLLPQPSLSRSRRVQQRQSFPSRTIVNLANQSITALNDLATSFPSAAGSTTRRSVLLSRHQQQQQILHQYHLSNIFLNHPLVVFINVFIQHVNDTAANLVMPTTICRCAAIILTNTHLFLLPYLRISIDSPYHPRRHLRP